MADGTFIYRFARDLRLDDHAGLAAAATHGALVPLLVIDPALKQRLKASPRRAAFFCGAVRSLDAELRERGSRLIVRRGNAAAILASVAKETGSRGVAWSASYDGASIGADQRLQSKLEEGGFTAVVVHDAPAIPPDDTAAARSVAGLGYRAFVPYFEVWSVLPVSSHEHPLLVRFASADIGGEALPAPHEFGSSEREAESGPLVARNAFEKFMRESAIQYAVAARVPSDDRTSRLSAHLSFGTLSARTIVSMVRKRFEDPFLLSEERASLRAFLRAIARRDFFLQLSWFYPDTQDEPLQEKMRGFTFARSHSALDEWRQGRTGFPLVDAGLRELRETGWMHPHARAVAASFLCFDLGVDWRIGREHWNRQLIEDDMALATGNWQWIAGVGADMAQFPRIYNPERQRLRYDPNGTYVRRWVRELENVPMAVWHESAAASAQLALELFSNDRYPQPVVDHGQAARAFLTRYRAFVSG
ncbi:MAG: deoxyribodipyrimidine photo-lyase [Candidatus Eremiobacteraeota bacterium]|nr:deoxyribodipyrimidine photo-lyase [Candidatus Eremiobacteraeota bacterium]